MNDKINEYLDILTNSGPGEEIRDALVRALIIMDAEHIKDENVADKLIPAALSPTTLEGLETECNTMIRTDWRRVTERLYDNTGLKVANKNAFRNLSSVLSRYKFVKTLIDNLPKGYKESLPVTYDYDAYGAYDIKKSIEFLATPYTTVQYVQTHDVLDDSFPAPGWQNSNLLSMYVGDATSVRIEILSPIKAYASPVISLVDVCPDVFPYDGEHWIREHIQDPIDSAGSDIELNVSHSNIALCFLEDHDSFPYAIVMNEAVLNALNIRYLVLGQLGKNIDHVDEYVYDKHGEAIEVYPVGPGIIGYATFKITITHSRLLSR